MPGKLRDWYESTLGHALVGAALLWAALPPLNLWPLAWIAPLWWVLLVRRRQLAPSPPRPALSRLQWAGYLLAIAVFFACWLAALAFFQARQYQGFWWAEVVFWPIGFALWLLAAMQAGRRPYVVLWLVGFLFWAAAVHWLRLSHWATSFGWLALAIYFGTYLPVFVGLSRVAVHVLRIPVILAVPVVWTGMELAQAHLLTGMTMGCVGHTQYRWTDLIQVSDLGGSYAVTFLVMFVAACLARILPCDGQRRAFWPWSPPWACWPPR